MAYAIDAAPCINCGLCRLSCPTGAIEYFSTGRRVHAIDPEWCIDCDLCARVCPVHCISSHPELRPAPQQLERARERARRFARTGREIRLRMDAVARGVVERRREVPQ